MLLCIDIGNTNIVIGVFDKDVLAHCWRIATDRQKTSDEYGILLVSLLNAVKRPRSDIGAIVISNVVPPLQGVFEEMCLHYFRCAAFEVGPGTRTGMPILTENPREVGTDLVVESVAAYEIYGKETKKNPPRPLVVADFGTASTFCAVSRDGEYLGVAIAPGITISADALFARTARLPRIELARPPGVIGKNTVQSMQAGIVFGFAGLTEGLIGRLKEELGQDTFVVATGGLANLIQAETRCIDVVHETLILEGLRIIYERNVHPRPR